jgi:hypothetical protein
MGYAVDTKVDAQIESFRSLHARIDLDRSGAGTHFDTLPSPQARTTPKWARIIHPLMLSADSM